MSVDTKTVESCTSTSKGKDELLRLLAKASAEERRCGEEEESVKRNGNRQKRKAWGLRERLFCGILFSFILFFNTLHDPLISERRRHFLEVALWELRSHSGVK